MQLHSSLALCDNMKVLREMTGENANNWLFI